MDHCSFVMRRILFVAAYLALRWWATSAMHGGRIMVVVVANHVVVVAPEGVATLAPVVPAMDPVATSTVVATV